MKKIVIILALVGSIKSISVDKNHKLSETGSCALQACAKLDQNKINVHLIPHSHDDVGWLKTVDDYFYGLHNDIANVGVEYILDSILQALQQDQNRRYIQVETAYFWKWWQIQSQEKRDLFKSFVDSGRIEIVGGGWSMNDEACVNYQSTINQFTWGLRLLNDTLGQCGRPRIGWQIDPFGHSREQALIFKQMGYEAIFFWRLSEDDKLQRKSTKDLEFMWKSSDNFENSEIFTSIIDGYYGPSGFCWDYRQCSSDAINDDQESFDYNLDTKIADFSELVGNYSSYFKTNNILYAMGGDFQYQAAEINYLNMDKLIAAFKTNENYNVFYSTPSCYLEAVNAANVKFSTKETGDFFPYNENANLYWTGYFSSRSTLKRYERTGNNILQASQQLNAFGKMRNIFNGTECEENIRSLRVAVGTMQHHDAITGTEKERVAYDYSRILTKAIRDTEKSIGKTIGDTINNKGKEIIVRYSMADHKDNFFYTDSNGRQMIQRTRNNFPYNNDSIEPVASNYYPVTSRISIKNEESKEQLSILTDRSQAGGSLNGGDVELLVHRRTLMDDHKGLDETLQEMEYDEYIVTRGQHYVVVGTVDSSRTERILSLNKLTQPWMLVADATSEDMSLEKLQAKLNFMWIGCTINGNGNGLPPNINVLNLEPWKEDTYLLRLEHIFEKNEDDEYSKTVSIEMKSMFDPFIMTSVREMSLGANSWINGTIGGNYEVTLDPMEIRTFVVTFKNTLL